MRSCKWPEAGKERALGTAERRSGVSQGIKTDSGSTYQFGTSGPLAEPSISFSSAHQEASGENVTSTVGTQTNIRAGQTSVMVLGAVALIATAEASVPSAIIVNLMRSLVP